MQTKVGPAAIGVAVVIVILFCVFMYVRAVSSAGPRVDTSGGQVFKPPYTAPGANASPHNEVHAGAKPGSGDTGR